ncbi:hypothetical protein [Pseudomonas sp. H3_A05]
MGLEDEYVGDADWQHFVRLYEEDYLDDNARALAKAMDDNLDMAVVLYGKRGAQGRVLVAGTDRARPGQQTPGRLPQDPETDQAPENGPDEHAVTHKDTDAMEGIKLLEPTFPSPPTRLSNVHV